MNGLTARRDFLRTFRQSLLVGAAGCALVAAVAAPSAAQAQAGGGTEHVGQLQEIVVTAQRRAENLQDVPISVSAVTGQVLESTGINSTLFLPQVVPSVQMTRSGPSSIFFIRGVGNTSGGTGEEGANAFYIDGVYLADLQQANTEFNNIERVEVLKGPQGTLFGRNSSGGLINIITREPGEERVIKGVVGYGNYDTFKGQLYLSSPLTSTVSADLALTARKQSNGFGTNIATGEENMLGSYWGARSKVVWRPNETTKLVFAGDYWQSVDSWGNGFTIDNGSFAAAPPGSLGQPGTVPGPTPGSVLYGWAGEHNRNSFNPGTAKLEVWGVSLTATFDLGFAELTSISALRHLDAQSNIDSDYTPLTIAELYIPSESRTFQQEVRLASQSEGPLNWQVGAFFFRARAGVYDQLVFGSALGGAQRGQLTTSEMRTHSYAGFGEVSYDITPSTHLTLGARYTEEDRTLDAVQTPYNQVVPALITALTFSKKDEINYSKFTYRAAIRQDLSDDVNVYASYNRGFKSGVWSLQAPSGPPVKPQVTDAFEIGGKSELFDRMLRLNVAAYHYKVKNYQIRAAPGNAANPILLNATRVKVDGIEAGFQLAPTRELLIYGDMNLMKSKFGDFPGAPFTYPNPSVCTPGGPTPGVVTGPPTGGNRTCLGDASGLRVPLSPKFTANVGASYTVELGDDRELSFNALFSHNSGYFFEQDNRLKQKAFSLVSGSVAYMFNENLTVEVWARNLTNEKYYITKLASGTAAHGEMQPPRTYGVDLKFEF